MNSLSKSKYLAGIIALEAILIATTGFCFNEDNQKYSQGVFICRLLKAKYIEAQPWIEYSLIYKPIVLGRLTIWSGVSMLPGSEFDCNPFSNDTPTTQVSLKFASFADKFEWTYFDNWLTSENSLSRSDTSKGLTYHGTTINARENTNFDVVINDSRSHSYLACNTIKSIQLNDSWATNGGDRLMTMCQECGQSNIMLVNNLIQELIKLEINNEIVDNLNWHLTTIIGNQAITGPIPL